MSTETANVLGVLIGVGIVGITVAAIYLIVVRPWERRKS